MVITQMGDDLAYSSFIKCDLLRSNLTNSVSRAVNHNNFNVRCIISLFNESFNCHTIAGALWCLLDKGNWYGYYTDGR